VIKNLGNSFCKIDLEKLTIQALSKKSKAAAPGGRTIPRSHNPRIKMMLMCRSHPRRRLKSERLLKAGQEVTFVVWDFSYINFIPWHVLSKSLWYFCVSTQLEFLLNLSLCCMHVIHVMMLVLFTFLINEFINVI
jgi:hypothetical protein